MAWWRRNFLLLVLLFAAAVTTSAAVSVIARVSRFGIQGNVTLEQTSPGGDVAVRVQLTHVGSSALPAEPWRIGIFPNPVDYSAKDICRGVGEKALVDLTKHAGGKSLLSNLTFSVSPGDEPHIEILGAAGTIWGRALRIQSADTDANQIDVCGSLQALDADNVKTKTVRARFRFPLGGSVWFRSVDFGSSAAGAATHTLIYSDLYDVSKPDASRKYPWSLYATEARFAQEDDADSNCKNLLNVFDPEGRSSPSSVCSKDKPENCPLGDLAVRHGELEIGNLPARFSRMQVVDPRLALPELGSRVLYLVVKEPDAGSGFYACAKLTPSPPRTVIANISSQGVQGSFTISQVNPFEPTRIATQLSGLEQLAGGFHVHQFPVPPPSGTASKVCADTGGHFNPFSADFAKAPQPGSGTDDQYEVGDLSGKHGFIVGLAVVEPVHVWDTMLPLWGPRSISGRSIVIHKADEKKSRWVCATLHDTRPVVRALVTFKWPFVGTIELRQAEDEPDSETTVFIESLVYIDDTASETSGHNWHVHVKPPESFKDSINWEKRCSSVGGHYNPFKIAVNGTSYAECAPESPEYCEIGDLAKRWGQLKIVTDKTKRNVSRFFFSDTYLPLSGRHSVLDKSIVVHADDHLNRGNRLGCAKIIRAFRHKGVVREWGTDDDPQRRVIGGSLEFTQESRYDPTRVKVSVDSLLGLAGGYHVHEVPVEIENQFPCKTTEKHWNPFNVSTSPVGAHLTVDQYEVGDLSAKHGKLDDLRDLKTTYEDLNLPMFGNTSILGRSIVVHKLEKGARWSCGSVVWGYDPAEAEQRSAIASFHHPKGFVRGYIRFRQVIYKNGFETETFIEVNLKHAGEEKNKKTTGHNWEIFNARPGSDAWEKAQSSRCRSAGNGWDPVNVKIFRTKKDLYDKQCAPDLPFSCTVGDMSGKLGPISIGDKRVVLSDPHYPLSGQDNGMIGKSVVIYDENGSAERFACAAIEPDDDVVKTVTVQKSASYSQTQFLNDVREILGAPEWMVLSDVAQSKDIHLGECEQLNLRFRGPKASQLLSDFDSLLASGSLARPTMAILGEHISAKRSISYKTCSQSGGRGAPSQRAPNGGRATSSNVWTIVSCNFLAVIIAVQVRNFVLPTFRLR